MTHQPFTVAHFRAWAAQLRLDNGQPWQIEPFQAAFLKDVFAGYQECWLIVPEGNAKTTLIAGLALYHCQFQQSANVPVAASSRDQGEILFRQADGFIERDRLSDAKVKALRGFKSLEGYRRIRFDALDSRIQIFAADDRTGDGAIPSLALIDELHRHRDLRLYRTWRGKLEKRKGQVVTISTAGEPGSEFETTRERIRQEAKDVTRKGAFVRAATNRLVLHEWAVPEDGDVEDFKLVKAANPLKQITATSLKEKFASPTMTLGHWRRFVCNLPTRSESAAITENEWAAARTDDIIPAGESVYLGLDVAWKWDTTALVPLWTPARDRRVLGPATVLVPPRDGSSLEPSVIEQALLRLHQRTPIHTVVMNIGHAEQLGAWITENLGAEVVDRAQTNIWAGRDYARFMEGLRNGSLLHSGDAGLTQHAMNAVARTLPMGDTRFDRPSQSRLADQERRVIDALTAAAMVNNFAVDRWKQPAELVYFTPISESAGDDYFGDDDE